MLHCNETITIVHCDGTAYTSQTVAGVSWSDVTRIVTEAGGFCRADSISIRIPADHVPVTLPKLGDQIIKGALPAGTTISTPAQLADYDPHRVMAVHDNRRGRLAHVAVVVE